MVNIRIGQDQDQNFGLNEDWDQDQNLEKSQKNQKLVLIRIMIWTKGVKRV